MDIVVDCFEYMYYVGFISEVYVVIDVLVRLISFFVSMYINEVFICVNFLDFVFVLIIFVMNYYQVKCVEYFNQCVFFCLLLMLLYDLQFIGEDFNEEDCCIIILSFVKCFVSMNLLVMFVFLFGWMSLLQYKVFIFVFFQFLDNVGWEVMVVFLIQFIECFGELFKVFEVFLVGKEMY